jgi:hypothetical protein
MAARNKADEDPTDAAARGDTPKDPEVVRLMEENRNLRETVNQQKEELDRWQHQGTPAADDGGKAEK